ncbi:protein-glutamate methylesterase/protein-glutamine glutaminase [Sphingomonas sp. 8AM]|uniref:protein-glutamate methylesterase/protein-glutamine glutaminase n=1 Tax=Sphingomonas sp. 8AM TaxID=2653170 RepID=UPI0012F393E5|nr:chemotaxis response regulator protein-glutamate methylesterase [Sphingomonas sp. 8AM]VXD03940.1 fused chemotaxis regulator; protein-glutamate methylesterase in two-component regulatory system with CheA [Sphingomonas sp. 8AM]
MSVRTLVVDDSLTMQALIQRTLACDPDIQVVGTASSAEEARARIKELDPDVVTLDIEMPGMNGLDFLERLMRLRPTPVVMLSTLTSEGADASIAALELGAFECFDKLALRRPDDAIRLPALVRAASGSRGRSVASAPRAPEPAPAADYTPRDQSMIAVGASTGGVEALIELLSGFPVNCPPTVIVQHMPPSFTASFAARLDRLCKPSVEEARAGAVLRPGKVYLAPGGDQHLEIAGPATRRYCRLLAGPKMSGHQPSVDVLFQSVARVAGADAVGAILTGMGADGAEGMLAMRHVGSVTIGQDEASSVVYGMPAVAHRIGAVVQQMPLRRIAARLLQECRA